MFTRRNKADEENPCAIIMIKEPNNPKKLKDIILARIKPI
jgi:hypothetical protein